VQQIAGSGNQNMNPMGYAGGLQFGYNQEISSNWVLGAEADFGALVANDSVTVKTVYSCCSPYFFTIAQKVSTDWMSTIRTRVGHTFAKRGLLFVSGGGAETRLRYSSLFTDNYASAHESASASVLRTGWIAGAGWEYALNRHWSWRAEYLHADFGSVSNAGSVLSTLQGTSTYNYPANPFTHTATLTSNIAHVALNYRF